MHTTITALQRNLDNPLRIAIRLPRDGFRRPRKLSIKRKTPLSGNLKTPLSGWSRHSCATRIRFNASRFSTERDAKSRSVRRCHPSPSTTGGFPSCTSTPTATPLQVQLPPSHLVHRICLQPSLSRLTFLLPVYLSPPTTSVQSCQLIPEMPVQHHRYH